MPGYVAYRIIRRGWGRPAPPLRTVSGAIVVIVIVGILAFIALPMFMSIATRARYGKTQNDIRVISGQTAGLCLEKLPTPPCCGRSEYTYKRWIDGRYLLKYSAPEGNFPAVLERGP